MKISKHFSDYEILCKCRKNTCGYKTTDVLSTNKFLNKLIVYLDNVRDEFGGPVSLSSVLRCNEHPVEMRKDTPGAHSMGSAADIVLPPDSLAKFKLISAIMNQGLKHKFQGLGIAKTFVHVDFGHPKVARPAYWTYK